MTNLELKMLSTSIAFMSLVGSVAGVLPAYLPVIQSEVLTTK